MATCTAPPSPPSAWPKARHYLQAGRDSFDLIALALTQTASADGYGLALTESYIHSLETFESALRRLTPNGRLALVFQEEPSSNGRS